MAKGLKGFVSGHPILATIISKLKSFGSLRVSIDLVNNKGIVVFEYDFDSSIDENLKKIKSDCYEMHQNFVSEDSVFFNKK